MGEGEWIYGRNPVLEALRAERRVIKKIEIASGAKLDGPLEDIAVLAKERGLPLRRVPKEDLERVHPNHQGVLALTSEYGYASMEAVFDRAADRDENPFILLLDIIQDPQNLGTLLRTAEAVGVHGVVVATKRSATVTPAVVSASSGASEHLLIAQYNIAQAIRFLKERGVWVAGLEGSDQAQPLKKVDLSGPIALVVGHEGSGLRRLVRESCDYLVRIPMRGAVESLNAAVAGSIVLFHVWERRDFEGLKA